jgi:hypothetical protein
MTDNELSLALVRSMPIASHVAHCGHCSARATDRGFEVDARGFVRYVYRLVPHDASCPCAIAREYARRRGLALPHDVVERRQSQWMDPREGWPVMRYEDADDGAAVVSRSALEK